MVKLVNRAKMTTASTGTGTITLGSASDGYQTFAAAGVSNSDKVRYTIEDGNAWEIGQGQYTSSGTLLSRTVSESSNSGNALNLSGNAVVFVTAIADDVGARTYATISDMTSSTSASEGDMAFVTGTNGLFIKKTAGWYKIAEVENNQLESVTVTMSGGGTAGDPYALALDGTDTLATGAATDPEGLSVTWSAAAISPATLSGNNIVVSSTNVATITQGTGASSNVFTIDPVATSGTHNFSLRFSVTDGINATINTDKNYTLNFVTVVANSKYTTLLAQAAGSGTNSSLTDSSSNNATLTNTGTPTAGTFSPYRSGGYSTYFGTSNYLSCDMTAIGTSNYTIEAWINFSSVSGNPWIVEGRYDSSSNSLGSGGIGVRIGSSGQVQAYAGTTAVNGTTVLSTDTWHHIMVVRSGTGTNEFKVYLDGSLEAQGTDAGSKTGTWFRVGGSIYGGNNPTGYIRDLRISTTARSTTTPTEPVEADSDTNWLGCSLPYIADASSSSNSITITGTPETRPFSPYDYSEYSAADNGGSIYLDGSSGASFSAINLGNTYTAECWFYVTGTSVWQTLFYHDPATSPISQLVCYVSNNMVQLRYYTKINHQTTVPINTWNHAALVADGTNVHLYLNGEKNNSTIGGGNVAVSSNPFKINSIHRSGEYLTGYIADARVINGTAAYSGNSFTPPSAPLSSSGTALHLKGTDASILDKAQSNNFKLSNNIAPTSVLTSSSTPAYIGANWANERAISFGNSGGNSARTKSFLPINQGSYTVESWINLNASSGTHTFFDTRLFDPSTNSNAGFYMMWRTDSGNYFRVGSGDGVYLDNIGSGDSLSTGTWYHIALVRDASQSSNNTSFFIDGIRKSQMHDTRNKTSDQATIGSNYSNSSIFDGYLQDFRVSHKARYDVTSSDVSSNIPTAPLEA